MKKLLPIENFKKLKPQDKDIVLSQVLPFENLELNLTENISQKENKPFTSPIHIENTQREKANNALKHNQVAAVILAGGDGSRLNFDKPKGCFPICPKTNKSLFELQLEKIKTLQDTLRVQLQLCIITSENNHAYTKEFLESHQYFGLESKNVTLLIQPSLPLLSENKELFFKAKNKVAKAPSGNGDALLSLVTSGYIKKLEAIGIKHVMITPIDNPLANPFELDLIDRHITANNDLSLYCFEREHAEEKVGVLGYENNAPAILDYNNLSASVFIKKTEKSFYFPYANTNIFCLSLECLKKISQLKTYWVKKNTIKYCIDTQKIKKIIAYKGERFITDILPFASAFEAILCHREEKFAPLKEIEGENGIDKVQRALEKFYKILSKPAKTDV